MRKIYTIILFTFLCLASYSQNTLDSSLVANYPFNGNDSDYSVYGNHANYNNASLTEDRFGNKKSAYKFNGINQYIRVPNSSSLNTGNFITLCSWVKVSGFYYGRCHGNMIMQKGDNGNLPGVYTLLFSDLVNNCGGQLPDTLNQKFYGLNSGFSANNNDVIIKEKWYFVVYTYDGTYAKLYIDGRLKNTNYAPGTFFGNSHNLFFGKLNDPQYPYWLNGSLDDIRIYNRALNLSEVRNLYNELPKATVTGNVFIDNNNDGIKDSIDYDASFTKVKLSNGDFAFTDYDGNYSLNIDSTGQYILEPDTVNNAYFPNPINDTLNVNSLDTTFERNFRYIINNKSKDSITVKITPLLSAARPGFPYPCVVNYVNDGNSILNITNEFKFDSSILVYDSSSSIGIIKNWNILSSSNNLLYPSQRNVFIAYFHLKPTANLGDTLRLFTTASAGNVISNDSLIQRIRGSYDPNDITANINKVTTQEIAQGKFIEYTIRFENTGTDTAFTVVIHNQISSLLNLNSLQLLSASHNFSANIDDRKIIFRFNNILLPHTAQDKINSHGYIKYRIKINDLVSDGTDIPNTASIYFDYNLPIITNTSIVQVRNPIITPLKFISLQVKKIENNKHAQIQFVTSNEINVSHFEIERSLNGINFEKLGNLNAENKTQNNYSFIDQRFEQVSNIKYIYYRIKSIDKDGTSNYSNTFLITNNSLFQAINIFPNPAKNKLNIVRQTNIKQNAKLINSLGQIVKQILLTKNIESIDIENLNTGKYFIIIEGEKAIGFIKN